MRAGTNSEGRLWVPTQGREAVQSRGVGCSDVVSQIKNTIKNFLPVHSGQPYADELAGVPTEVWIESGVVYFYLLGTSFFNMQWHVELMMNICSGGGGGGRGAGKRQENGFIRSVLFARWLTEKDGDGMAWVSYYLVRVNRYNTQGLV